MDILSGVCDGLQKQGRCIFGVSTDDCDQGAIEFCERVIGLQADEFGRSFFERFEFTQLQQDFAFHRQEPRFRWQRFEKGVDAVERGDILFPDDHSVDFLHLGEVFAALAKLDFLTVTARTQTVLIE